MVSVNNLTVEFVGRALFDSISFTIDKGNRIGLVGRNGAGKSTLLKIISKNQEPTKGNIVVIRDVKVGYLEQDIDFIDGFTVKQEAEKAFAELNEVEKRIDVINAELAERSDYESDYYMDLIHDLNECTDKVELLGGSQIQGDIEKVLKGLGFQSEDFERQSNEFSGGWRMRIELAKLLLSKPDVLLLDEPTNHLDIESIIWLEGFLQNYIGAVVLVSHDKMFLDNVCNRTIEISLGKIFDYKASYSKYLILREERYEKQMQSKINQDKEIKQTEDLIEKFRYKASKAAFAQSLIKKLDKIDRIEVEGFENQSMSLNFNVGQASGKVVVEALGVSKSYGDNKVLNNLDFIIERGAKIAFVGQNGQGKTTLARMINKELAFDGMLKLGHNVDIGYFAQNQSGLFDENITVLETLENAADERSRTKVRDILGAFLFRGEDVDKKVKVLSGGERGRLSLAKLLLKPHNVLILDEPTNHLDMNSKEVLKEALKKYSGTLILVSHDRDFLQGLSDLVYEFKDGGIREHLGDIDFFLEQKKIEDMRLLALRDKENSKNVEKADSVLNKKNWKNSRNIEKKVKRIKNQINNLEKDIAILEGKIEKFDIELSKPGGYEFLSNEEGKFESYDSDKKQLDAFFVKWELFQEELDSLL
ncbi:MAG: ABC-F family ATP-binding cassette domain-containing protein [Flavobacteriales bacterium]|nr:ABC-F family ATP-binding cassette domain-containing protein [Flavobacteriales bacterium]